MASTAQRVRAVRGKERIAKEGSTVRACERMHRERPSAPAALKVKVQTGMATLAAGVFSASAVVRPVEFPGLEIPLAHVFG
jgi:hypothetical protein